MEATQTATFPVSYLKTLDSVELSRIRRRYTKDGKEYNKLTGLIELAKLKEKETLRELNRLLKVDMESLYDLQKVLKSIKVRRQLLTSYSLSEVIYLLREVYNTDDSWVLLDMSPFEFQQRTISGLREFRDIYGISHRSIVHEMVKNNCSLLRAFERLHNKGSDVSTPVKFNGVTYPSLECALKSNNSELIIYYKYKRLNMSDEQAFEQAVKECNSEEKFCPQNQEIEYDGITFANLFELSNYLGVRPSILSEWLKGLSGEDLTKKINKCMSVNVKSKLFGYITNRKDIFTFYNITSSYYNTTCSRFKLNAQQFVDRLEENAVPYNKQWLFTIIQIQTALKCSRSLAFTLVNKVHGVPIKDRREIVDATLLAWQRRRDYLTYNNIIFESFEQMSKVLKIPLKSLHKLARQGLTGEEFHREIESLQAI